MICLVFYIFLLINPELHHLSRSLLSISDTWNTPKRSPVFTVPHLACFLAVIWALASSPPWRFLFPLFCATAPMSYTLYFLLSWLIYSFLWCMSFKSYSRKSTWEGEVFKSLHAWKCLSFIYTLEWRFGNNFCSEFWMHCFTRSSVAIKKHKAIWIPDCFHRTLYLSSF